MCRVDPVRRNLRQRLQHERALAKAWVRHVQPLLVQHFRRHTESNRDRGCAALPDTGARGRVRARWLQGSTRSARGGQGRFAGRARRSGKRAAESTPTGSVSCQARHADVAEDVAEARDGEGEVRARDRPDCCPSAMATRYSIQRESITLPRRSLIARCVPMMSVRPSTPARTGVCARASRRASTPQHAFVASVGHVLDAVTPFVDEPLVRRSRRWPTVRARRRCPCASA